MKIKMHHCKIKYSMPISTNAISWLACFCVALSLLTRMCFSLCLSCFLSFWLAGEIVQWGTWILAEPSCSFPLVPVVWQTEMHPSCGCTITCKWHTWLDKVRPSSDIKLVGEWNLTGQVSASARFRIPTSVFLWCFGSYQLGHIGSPKPCPSWGSLGKRYSLRMIAVCEVSSSSC